MYKKYYSEAKKGGSVGKFASNKKQDNDKVLGTIVSSSQHFHPYEMREISNSEFCKGGSYPKDYNFIKIKPQYLIGMSVPPIMIAQISNQIFLQWLKEDNTK